MEKQILAACVLSKAAYNQCIDLDMHKNLSQIPAILFKEISNFYEIDPDSEKCDVPILKKRIEEKYKKHHEIINKFLEDLPSVSVPNTRNELQNIKKKLIKQELAVILQTDEEEHAEELILQLQNLQTPSERNYQITSGKDLQEILQKNKKENLIKLLPDAINSKIGGGVHRGHHILVFARPDAGKTTMALTMAYGFLRQNLKVLYVCNEDPLIDIQKRAVVCITGMEESQLYQEPEKARQRLQERNYQNLLFVEMWPGSVSEIEEIMKQERPDVLIVDQARNLRTKQANRVLELEFIERELRNIGKKYDALTVSFTQAGDSASNKLVLEMGDVDNSNTGMQAAADLMIGLGVNSEYEIRKKRMLSFPKNKRGGDKQPIQVDFMPEIGRIK